MTASEATRVIARLQGYYADRPVTALQLGLYADAIKGYTSEVGHRAVDHVAKSDMTTGGFFPQVGRLIAACDECAHGSLPTPDEAMGLIARGVRADTRAAIKHQFVEQFCVENEISLRQIGESYGRLSWQAVRGLYADWRSQQLEARRSCASLLAGSVMPALDIGGDLRILRATTGRDKTLVQQAWSEVAACGRVPAVVGMDAQQGVVAVSCGEEASESGYEPGADTPDDSEEIDF